jgi:hypothetical protein
MKISGDEFIGPYEDYEMLELVTLLRAKGLKFFVADETGVAVVDQTIIRASRFE